MAHLGRGAHGDFIDQFGASSRLFLESVSIELFNGVLIIKKYYRGAELGIALIWDLMTQSRSQVGQEMCVTDVLKAKTCSLFTSPLSEFVDVTFILWFLP